MSRDMLGSDFSLERHRGCTCTWCCGDRAMRFPPLHLGLNLPECKMWNAWIVIHWRWRGVRWYLRFTRGRLFGRRKAA